MQPVDHDRNDIYDRTSGYCHICHRKLAFTNYGKLGARGAWEIEHSRPQAKGGTHRLNNLDPACISCNRSKGPATTSTARARAGTRKAPLSPEKRRRAKTGAALASGITGGLLGAALAGPLGAWVGGAIGARLGYKANPDH